jgi:ATP-binding cassette subfamily B protein
MREFASVSLRLLRFLHPYRWRVLGAYLAMTGATLLSLAVPAILGWSIDLALGTGGGASLLTRLPGVASLLARLDLGGRKALLVAAALLLAIALLRGLLNLAETYLGAWLGQRVAYDLRNAFFNHLQRLSFGFHDRAQSGDLMSRAIGDIGKIQTFLGEGLLEAVNVPILFAAVGGILLWRAPALALASLGPLLILVLVTLRFGQVIEPRFRAVQDQEGVIATRAQENFTGMRVVKAFAREPFEIVRYAA